MQQYIIWSYSSFCMWEWGGLGTSVTIDHKLYLTVCSAHLCCSFRTSQNVDSLPVACAHTGLRSWNHQERYLRFASTFVNTLIISAQIAMQTSDLASCPCSVHQMRGEEHFDQIIVFQTWEGGGIQKI